MPDESSVVIAVRACFRPNVSEADTLADYHSIFLEIVRYSCYGVCVSDHTDDHTGRSDYRADTTCGNESGDKSGCAGYKTYPVCQGMDDLFCFLDIQYLIIAKISFVIHRVTEILMVFAGLIPSNHFFPVFVHELIDHSPILKIGCAKLKS